MQLLSLQPMLAITTEIILNTLGSPPIRISLYAITTCDRDRRSPHGQNRPGGGDFALSLSSPTRRRHRGIDECWEGLISEPASVAIQRKRAGKVKLAHWPKKVLSLLVLVALGATAARGAIQIDSFGEPHQTIKISGNSVAVSSPYPDDDLGTSALTSSNVIRQRSGPYSGPLGDTSSVGTGGYNGTVSNTYYAYANGNARQGGIISSTPLGGQTDFSQRDVLLTVTGTGDVAYTAGLFELSGLTGGSATLLLQYDGVDSNAVISGNVIGDGVDDATPDGTYVGTAFQNAQGLDDGLDDPGYDLLVGGNDRFYFGGVKVNARGTSTDVVTTPGVLVTVRVWTVLGGTGVNDYQEATAIFADTDGGTANYSILFSAFNGGTGASNFNQVTGVDIIFQLENDEDLYLGAGDGPSPGLFATNPEPATLAIWSLLSLGGVGLGYFRRRKLVA